MLKTFLGIKIDAMELDQNGFLRIKDAKIARIGVLRYIGQNEYRDAKEVFNPRHLESIDGLPVTSNHPPTLLNTLNVSRYQIGSVSNPRQDSSGTHIIADILITDSKAIRDVQGGKRELSMGYTSEDIQKSGSFDGANYSIEQTKLFGNHLAIVEQGRCGTSCRMDSTINLDTLDGVTITSQLQNKESVMARVKIDGVDYEVEDNALAKAIADNQTSLLTKADNALETVETLTSERDTLQGKFDSLQEQVKTTESSKMDAEKINALVQETVIVSAQAKKLDEKFDCNGKDVMSIMRGVLGDKADSKSDDYVRGMFAMQIEAKSDEKAGDLNKGSNESENEDEGEDKTREAFKKKMLDKKKGGK